MNYLVLARRTRPQSLNELVGQNPIRNALKSMLESNKIPHAFLFTGTRGTGKTSTARILAKSLNCEQGPSIAPCQTCRHCKQISACAHEDVFEIDGASHTGVDNIRELREATRFYPVSARYKIFIIDEVHMLSTGAFNALLKTLEEPPAQVIFILATTELHKIPITIRSRCLTFAFKKINSLDISAHLESILKAENIEYEPEALKLIAREAHGSLRDSLSLLEQVLVLRSSNVLTLAQTKQSLGLYNDEIALQLFCAICNKDQAKSLELLKEADNSGLDLSLIVESAAHYFKHALLFKSSSAASTQLQNLLPEEYQLLQKHIVQIDAVALSEIFKILLTAVKDLQQSIHPLSWAEVVVIDAITRADWISASDMLAKLQKVPTASPVKLNLDNSTTLNRASANTTNPAPTHSSKIDLELYKRFVEAARKRSPTLGARLNFVKLETFSAQKIVFADTAENKTYLSFDAKDKELFWKSLEDVGISAQALEGQNVKNSSISLHQIQEDEKKKAYSLKEKEILSRESVKNLMVLSKEIKLTPIEN